MVTSEHLVRSRPCLARAVDWSTAKTHFSSLQLALSPRERRVGFLADGAQKNQPAE